MLLQSPLNICHKSGKSERKVSQEKRTTQAIWWNAYGNLVKHEFSEGKIHTVDAKLREFKEYQWYWKKSVKKGKR